MKKITLMLLAVAFLFSLSHAQFVNTPPASKKAALTEYIGLTKVHISYHRPGVKGREGNLYGNQGLVPYDGQPFPWRAGANENTVMYFGDDVKINGQELPAGKYGFHVIPSEGNEWTLVFSKNNWSWGSFNYDVAEDALRVTATAGDCDMVEWLKYEFVNQTDNSADIELSWEKRKVSFTVEADVHEVTMQNIQEELDGIKGFTWQGMNSAAAYTLNAEKDLEKGLAWAERSSQPQFGGQKNFTTLSTQSQIMAKMGKEEAAKTIMDEAIGMATMVELHFYGRNLIQQNKPKEAMEIFEMNAKNNPEDNFTTYVGLARGNMALENYEVAAKYFKKAAPNAPQGQESAYLGLAKQCEEKASKGD